MTVDELASAIGVTDNAVRLHLTALERDGLVRAEGVRREGSVGKPATLYAVTPDAQVASWAGTSFDLLELELRFAASPEYYVNG